MKSAKPPPTEAPAASSHRRSQPVRQTRANPPRSSASLARPGGGGRGALAAAGPVGDQPIDIFPAITHFADAVTALPRELVRHFTLLKEVDAKLYAPEEQLVKLVAATAETSSPDQRAINEAASSIAPASAPMSTQNSSSGIVLNNSLQTVPVPPSDDSHSQPVSVMDPSNLPRRQLFRQTAFKIQEMLVSLEEKNHVISTANEALQRQLNRIEDVWPYLENEFSDEAKWGSTMHWAYPENRSGRLSHAERTRRDGAAVISAAAQALVDEAAARSDARKQAVQAKRNLKNNHHDSDLDDNDGRHKGEGTKKSLPSKSRKLADVGLGISASSSTNGNPPQKKRKVEKHNGAAPTERAMASVFGSNGSKAKANSPRTTPAPEGPKKRKALPSGSGQPKKSKNGPAGMSPSITSSPVMADLADPKLPARASPAPSSAPRPTTSRARQNSLQSNVDNGKARPASSASNKPNGYPPGTPELAASGNGPRPGTELRPGRESSAPTKVEPSKKETDRSEASSTTTLSAAKKEAKPEENDRKSESIPPSAPTMAPVTTKSGRASKPSTPALATFHEAAAAARSRSARAENGGGGANKKGHKKSASTVQVAAPAPPPPRPRLADEDAAVSSGQGDDEAEIDADEPTYCYCNSVSYGEMVACDSDDCEREWFHLACVGLRVAPGSKTKWYCDDCKDRLRGRKAGGR